MTETNTPKRNLKVDDVANCTCANLRKATRAITQVYDDVLRPYDLRATQFTLLAALSKTGDVPLTRLAGILGMDRTTLTRNLKPLIRRQLINIAHEDDQRIRKLSLSDVGKRVLDQALPEWQKVQLVVSQRLGQERWAGLLDDLAAVSTSFDQV